MSDIPEKYLKNILQYKPVETEGLRLYPILVDEYEEFSVARTAIEFMHQSLPMALLNVPILQAYYLLDSQSVDDQQIPTGLLQRAILFLALALRIGQGFPAEKRVAMFFPKVGKNKKLISLVFSPDGEEICEITPAMFQRIRPILAAQNGLKIPEEDANPALVAAENELERQKAPALDVSLGTLITSVAAMCQVEESEIYDWPIVKLHNRQKAHHRMLDYVICGIAEAQGTKWKKGNPSPSPFFDRKKEGSAAKVPLSEFAGGAALNAVNEGAEATNQ